MENEIWKDVIVFNGSHQVSNLGRIKSLNRTVACKANGIRTVSERVLKLRIGKYGYPYVVINSFGKRKTAKLHRLVAEAFIPNPDNKPQINHINGIKSDNRVENLEWVTRSENMQHACNVLGRNPNRVWLGKSGKDHPRSKPVLQFTIGGEFVAQYGSACEAAREIGLSQGSISECCKGNRKTVGGYSWKYHNENK